MGKQNEIKYYYVNKYIIYGCLCMVAGILLTLLLYNLIGFSDSYRIMSKEMLLAIKQYNVNLDEFVKNKCIIRIIELIVVFVFIKSKYSKTIKWLLITYVSLRIGLVATVFIIEMQFIGIINYLIISFPQNLIYLYCLLKIFNIEEKFNELKNKSKKSLITIKYFINYVCILILWIIAILSETYIKHMLIKKVFIVPTLNK